ncbi:MAG: hypothetical protein DHS20C12_26120 [Pseudohongiella sp.]|nr:MAG: hypothetical protein DHS20C12_26120 [Pseudohongiella sp.]
MIILLRHRNTETRKVHDVKMSAPVVTIGSDLDQHLFVPRARISGRHAVIRTSRGQARLVVLGRNKLLVNGESVRRKTLEVGDEIQLGEQRIKVVAAPEGFDFACEMVVDPTERTATLAESWHRQLRPKIWTPRRLAYGFAAAILVIAFWLPYSAYLSGNDPALDEPWTDLLTAMNRTQNQGWRADSLWSPGPLLAAHQNAIGNDCTSCHTQAFVPVDDTACASCHDQSGQHFDQQLFRVSDSHSFLGGTALSNLTANLGGIAGSKPRCESCHKEHNEPQSIIATTDTLCTQCHQDALIGSDGSVMEVATAFNASEHPEFRYSFLTALSDIEPEVQNPEMVAAWKRITQTDLSVAVENSHLEFSHEIHLQLDEPALDCSNCHELDVDEEHFVAISMQDHCADCHKLEFDEREIPHGDPALAIRSIEEYFIARYLTPGREIDSAPRRLPGRLERSCEGTDYECAVQRAELEIQLQFGTSGCVTCHQVTAVENTASVGSPGWSPLSQSWHVEPVRINTDWYSNARFDHAAHLTQAGQSETELCSGCHQAESSDLSSDVLIPKNETCFGCHSDSSRNDRIAVDCVDCHLHHPSRTARAQLESN